jgi:tripartite-type tricarboxylate transporter receptor subunit TctC
MGLSRRECLRSAATAAIASAGVPRAAWSQAYPARPVRIIVPFAPGGPNDLAARLVAQKLSEQLGRQFYVENVGGAGGNIGMGQAARAAPDGYTMLAAAPSLVVKPGLYEKVPYDLYRDFEAVTIIASAPTVLTVHPSLPARTLEELVALIRANPGKYSYASPGTGTPPHLVGELFRLSLGLDLVHVAFSSGGLAINSAVAGHTPISFGAMPPAVPLVQDGKLRALAVTSGRRSHALPDVPTSAEAGHAQVAGDIWTAVLVPAGTPREIGALLQAEIAKALALPDLRERPTSLGYEPLGNSAEESAAQIRAEAAKWARVIRDAGIRAQ